MNTVTAQTQKKRIKQTTKKQKANKQQAMQKTCICIYLQKQIKKYQKKRRRRSKPKNQINMCIWPAKTKKTTKQQDEDKILKKDGYVAKDWKILKRRFSNLSVDII